VIELFTPSLIIYFARLSGRRFKKGEALMKKIILSALACLFVASSASAVELSNMWGIGYSKSFLSQDSGISSLSVRYWVDKQLGIEGLFGVLAKERDGGVDERYYNMGARFLIKIVEEDNLHVYGGGGIALIYEKPADDGDSGVAAQGFAGVEYFFQGLPHLGFSSEIGLALKDVGDNTSFGTTGDSFMNMGIRYYF